MGVRQDTSLIRSVFPDNFSPGETSAFRVRGRQGCSALQEEWACDFFTSAEGSLLPQAAFLMSPVLKPSLNALGTSVLASVPSESLTDFFILPVTLIIIVRHLVYNSFVALSWRRNSDNLS